MSDRGCASTCSHPPVIRRIELVTRQEAEYDQAETRRNFEIQASNDPDFASYVVLGSQGNTALPHMSTWSLDLESPVTYRYVRAKKSVDEYFFISELRVFPTIATSGTIGDADGDDLPDAWETANGLASDLRTDAAEDWDDDGHTNQQEYEADTDPRNPHSQLRMVDCRHDGFQHRLQLGRRHPSNANTGVHPESFRPMGGHRNDPATDNARNDPITSAAGRPCSRFFPGRRVALIEGRAF